MRFFRRSIGVPRHSSRQASPGPATLCVELPSQSALLKEKTTHAFDPSWRSDSQAVLPVYVATTDRQKATASGFAVEARMVQAPLRLSQSNLAAERPTPLPRNRRSTKYSATSRTLGSSAIGDPRLASANPAT